MNILLLVFAYLPSTGGVQRLVHDLAVDLVRRGHRVTIVTDGTWSGIETFGLIEGTPADILVLHIPDCFHWSMKHWLFSRCRDIYNVLRLVALCRMRGIQIVHGHLINVDTRYGVILKKLLGIKLAVTLHGNETSSWVEGQPHRLGYVKTMLRSADALTTLSQRQLDEARAMEPGLPAMIEVIPNPVQAETILAAVDGSVALPSAPSFIYVGRFVPCKSLDIVIEAYHRLVADDPSSAVSLALVGGGELEAALRRQAANGAGAGGIHFLGERPWKECLGLIQGAQALVFASHEDEGCPMVLLEARALGTPVIVSDNPRLAEMVVDGANGAVFACRDARALQQCLQRFPLSDERRDAYAREGRAYLQRRHRPESIFDAYDDLYRRMCP